MAQITDKLIGIHHFLTDRAPPDVPALPPKKHPENPWCQNDKPRVSKTTANGDIKASLLRCIAFLGELSQVIKSGDRVMVKPNFNSPDPFPASTDLIMLEAVLELMLELGAKVTVGESAGGVWRPTRNVFDKLGVVELTHRLGIRLMSLDDEKEWVKIKIGGDYLTAVTMPRVACEADRMVYLPCLKTHNLARFSGALKLAVGFMHPGERRFLHAGNLERKAAEINLCWQPDLVIMDGRKAFVAGGPDRGRLVEPGLILASGDMIALDVEAMKILLGYKANNRLMADPWQSPQVVAALKHGLGCEVKDYVLVGD